tara:strand:- start:1141 stop:2079 length:939 start_codon:yes stop_codon:yes gene_type:complete
MRLDPLTVILNQDFKPDKKFYFISGNEKSFMEKIKVRITEKYKKNENTKILNIESIINYVDETSLFEDKKIILIKNCKEINENNLNKFRRLGNIYLFIQENSQRIKKIKNIFLKDKDSYLIDCYELDRDSKIRILNEFIRFSGIDIIEQVYWFLVEKLDNKYAFLENSLNQILALEAKDITLSNIKKLLNIDSSGKEKIFLCLYKKNKEIISVYRDKVTTKSDVNELYYYCKSFCQLIIDCRDLEEYRKKIPIYLYKEKDFLIDIFKKYNIKKKKALLGLLSSTEKVLRKESGLSLMSGLRFLLNIKKITIS